MEFFSTSKTLGILGGGQLGKMLLYTTRKWDIKTSVLDPSENAPATLACDHFTKGDLTIQSLKIFKDSKNRRNVLIKYWDFESESWVESLLADVTELHKS